MYLQVAGSLATLIFMSAVVAVLHHGDERTRMLGSVALVGGIVALALVLAAQEMLGTLLTITLRDGSPEVTRGIYTAYRGVFTASYFFLGVFVASGGLGMLISRLLARWLGWLGLVSGVCHLPGSFSFATWHGPLELLAFVGLLLALLWMFLAGLWIQRGATPARSSAVLETA